MITDIDSSIIIVVLVSKQSIMTRISETYAVLHIYRHVLLFSCLIMFLMTFLYKNFHPIPPKIISLIVFTIFCYCLTSYLGYTYFDNSSTDLVTMPSKENWKQKLLG